MIVGTEMMEVESVTVEEDFILEFIFSNGHRKKVDLSNLLKNPPPVFLPLQNKDEFRKISVNPVGSIQWDCGVDLSADFLFAA